MIQTQNSSTAIRATTGFSKMTGSQKAFQVFNYAFLTLLGFVMFFPFYITVINSVAPPVDYYQRSILLWPSAFEPAYYGFILTGRSNFMNALGNTFYLVLVGTTAQIIITFLVSYVLSQRRLPFRNQMTFVMVFTMFFGGGMIPSYLLRQTLGLLNSLNGLIIGGLISTGYVLYLRNFLMTIPTELIESAHVDGCPEFTLLRKVIFPLALPALATFTLFYAVGQWNRFGDARIYILDQQKHPIQVYLNQIINMTQMGQEGNQQELRKFNESGIQPPAEALKATAIVCATVPIVLVYPFLQKYFVTGMMMGSLKG